MSDAPVLLFVLDGVILTQKALEYAALVHSRNKFYRWKNLDELRLIDFARLFEESDSSNRFKALFQAYKAYAPYIPSRWRRILFFMRFRRFYPKYERYESIDPELAREVHYRDGSEVDEDVCSMCGEFCAIKILKDALDKKESKKIL